MKSKYVLEKRNGYIYFGITGKYDRAEFRNYAIVIIDTCEREKIYRVLVDGLKVTGTDLSTMERYAIGEKIAELFPSRLKLAIAWPEQHINRFAETVAVNRGGFIRVVADVAAAEKWLLTPV